MSHLFANYDLNNTYYKTWRPVSNYPYVVSQDGEVKGIGANRTILKLKQTNPLNKYLSVKLHKFGRTDANTLYVHRLVALAFCENDDPIQKTFVDHIDKNRGNNKHTNLRWVTAREKNSKTTV